MSNAKFKKAEYILSIHDDHETWVTLQENESPVGTYYLSVSSVFTRAKNPRNRYVKFGLVIQDVAELRQLASFLSTF